MVQLFLFRYAMQVKALLLILDVTLLDHPEEMRLSTTLKSR